MSEIGRSSQRGATQGGSSQQGASQMDPGKKYGTCVSNNTNKWKCIFCMKETNGGISRLKHHLVGGNTSITVCPNCPEHVRALLQNDAAYKMLDRQPDLWISNASSVTESMITRRVLADLQAQIYTLTTIVQAMSVQPFPSTNDFDVEVDDAESKEEDNLEIYDDPVYDEYECESEEDLYKEIYGPPIFDIYEDDVVGDEGMSQNNEEEAKPFHVKEVEYVMLTVSSFNNKKDDLCMKSSEHNGWAVTKEGPRRLIINHVRRRWNYQSMKAFLTQPYLMAKTIEVWERFIILFDGYYQWKRRK
ncbi:hypothetical protein F2Q69_00013939 [Brassica cretica]|uniref:BED-type domain-containing protein n=1 Tax=Brassica cretica TaxID=69181 RepID=A0A8S9QTS3_BRACR|nr:hypothetical protein F2Q69_00013939 [Brassica cretica]